MQSNLIAGTSSSSSRRSEMSLSLADSPNPKRFKISKFSALLSPTGSHNSDTDSLSANPAKLHFTMDLNNSIFPKSFLNKIGYSNRALQPLTLKIPRETDEIPEIDLTISPTQDENVNPMTDETNSEPNENTEQKMPSLDKEPIKRKPRSPKVKPAQKKAKEETAQAKSEQLGPAEETAPPKETQPKPQVFAGNNFTSLRNLGSTCYINCIIQVMRYTPGFVVSIHRLNKQIIYLESLVMTICFKDLAENYSLINFI